MTKTSCPNTALRNMRMRQYLTQEQLAEIAGVTPRTIHRWEQGLSFPRAYSLQKLCVHFQATTAELGFSDLWEEPETKQESAALNPLVRRHISLLTVGALVWSSLLLLAVGALVWSAIVLKLPPLR